MDDEHGQRDMKLTDQLQEKFLTQKAKPGNLTDKVITELIIKTAINDDEDDDDDNEDSEMPLETDDLTSKVVEDFLH